MRFFAQYTEHSADQIETLVHEIMDNPELYPDYFNWNTLDAKNFFGNWLTQCLSRLSIGMKIQHLINYLNMNESV